jgi:hypothetical protein
MAGLRSGNGIGALSSLATAAGGGFTVWLEKKRNLMSFRKRFFALIHKAR